MAYIDHMKLQGVAHLGWDGRLHGPLKFLHFRGSFGVGDGFWSWERSCLRIWRYWQLHTTSTLFALLSWWQLVSEILVWFQWTFWELDSVGWAPDLGSVEGEQAMRVGGTALIFLLWPIFRTFCSFAGLRGSGLGRHHARSRLVRLRLGWFTEWSFCFGSIVRRLAFFGIWPEELEVYQWKDHCKTNHFDLP